MSRILGVVVLVSLLLSAAPAAAAAVATVTAVSGQASRNGAPLLQGQELGMGDTVTTGAQGCVQLRFADGSTVDVYPDSALQIEESLGAGLEAEEASPFSVSQLFGVLQAFVSRLRGDELVVTPTLSLGIRGTRFIVSVADDGTSLASVQQGAVTATSVSPARAGHEVRLEQGQQVTVPEQAAPLRLEPANVDTPEAGMEFRRRRLELLLPRMPEAAGRLQAQLERLVPELEGLRTAILEEAERLRSLRSAASRLGMRQQRREAGRQLVQESLRLRILARRFRIGATRGKGLFRRAARLRELVPAYVEATGATRAEAGRVEAVLDSILEQREATRTRILKMVDEVREVIQDLKASLRRARRSR